MVTWASLMSPAVSVDQAPFARAEQALRTVRAALALCEERRVVADDPAAAMTWQALQCMEQALLSRVSPSLN